MSSLKNDGCEMVLFKFETDIDNPFIIFKKDGKYYKESYFDNRSLDIEIKEFVNGTYKSRCGAESVNEISEVDYNEISRNIQHG